MLEDSEMVELVEKMKEEVEVMMDRIEAGLHFVLVILEEEVGEVIVVELSERGTELRTGRPRSKLRKFAEQSTYQRDQFLLGTLRKLLTRNQ
jgi:hypothetical protein